MYQVVCLFDDIFILVVCLCLYSSIYIFYQLLFTFIFVITWTNIWANRWIDDINIHFTKYYLYYLDFIHSFVWFSFLYPNKYLFWKICFPFLDQPLILLGQVTPFGHDVGWLSSTVLYWSVSRGFIFSSYFRGGLITTKPKTRASSIIESNSLFNVLEGCLSSSSMLLYVQRNRKDY